MSNKISELTGSLSPGSIETPYVESEMRTKPPFKHLFLLNFQEWSQYEKVRAPMSSLSSRLWGT